MESVALMAVIVPGAKMAKLSGRKMPPLRRAMERKFQKRTWLPSLASAIKAASVMVRRTITRVTASSERWYGWLGVGISVMSMTWLSGSSASLWILRARSVTRARWKMSRESIVPMPSESPAIEPMSESMMPPMAMPPSRDGCSVRR